MPHVGRYCCNCKSRKSSDPENLAKVDLRTSVPLRRFSTPLRSRRGRLFMVSPADGDYRRIQAETPLIDLFEFAEPAT